MAEIRQSDVQAQSFPAINIDNGSVSLTIVPELGGKLSSIRDVRTGREWLWTSAQLPYRRLPYGTSYVEQADTGGWDECFPTVAACRYPSEPWRGMPLPDHGEIWQQAWPCTIHRDEAGGLMIHTTAQGVALPYSFERSIRIVPDAATLRFEYRVRSLADAPIHFIWSAHPLLAIEPGMRILLPDNARFHSFVAVPDTVALDPEGVRWPPRIELVDRTLDFATTPDRSAGVAFKLWSEPLRDGWATLAAADGEFQFRWDPQLLPQVGVWLNAGAWSGAGGDPYYNLGLEPCIGAQDSLAEAVTRYNQYAMLPPHGERGWWLDVQLRSA